MGSEGIIFACHVKYSLDLLYKHLHDATNVTLNDVYLQYIVVGLDSSERFFQADVCMVTTFALGVVLVSFAF